MRDASSDAKRPLLLSPDAASDIGPYGRAEAKPPASSHRWLVLLAFCLATSCNGLLYSTEAAVTVQAEAYYRIPEAKVLLLTNVFYAGFIPFVFPAIWLLTRPDGLRWAVVGGIFALAAGAGLRCLAQEPNPTSFHWMLGGTAVLSISTPLLLGCITQVAANWFPTAERALATSIAVLCAQGGMMIAYVLPALMVPPLSTDKSGSASSGSQAGQFAAYFADAADEAGLGALKHELESYALVQFAFCTACAVLCLLVFRTRPAPASAAARLLSLSDGAAGAGAEMGLKESLVLCYSNPHFWVLSVVFGVSTPIYWTLGQLIDGAMGHAGSGWTADQVYICGTVLQAASFPGFLLGGYLVDRLRDKHTLVVNCSMLLATASIVAFSYALSAAAAVEGAPSSVLYAAVVGGCCACGFFFAMVQPPALELAAECTYPASEAASCSILYLNCQFAGIGLVTLADALTDNAAANPTAKVNTAMCALQGGMALLQIALFRGQLRRVAAQSSARLASASNFGAGSLTS